MRTVVVVLILGAASPALAQQVAAPASTVATDAPAPPKKPKLICKTMETLGTRLGGHRECATAAEWSERSRRATQDLQENDTHQRVPGFETGGA